MYTSSPEQPPPHPAKAVLVGRRMTVRTLAEQLGHHHVHVGLVLSRHRPASPKFRQRVSELLGLPESELFHEDPKGLRVR